MADDIIKSKTSIYRFKMADDVVFKAQLQIQNGRLDILCDNHNVKKNQGLLAFDLIVGIAHFTNIKGILQRK